MPTLSPRLQLPVPLGVGDGSDVPHWFDLWKSILDDAALFTQGTLLQRPVSTVPNPGIRGRFHYVTGDGTAVNNGILWLDTGTSWVIASTTGWYKSSATAVKTDGDIESASDIYARRTLATQVQTGSVGGNAGFALGAALDANFYRSAAGVVKTDGAFVAAGGYSLGTPITGTPAYQSQQVAAQKIIRNKLLAADANDVFRILGDGKMEWGLGGATAPDTNLYRSGVDVLRTDDSLVVAMDIYARGAAATQVALGDISILGVGGTARAGIVFGSGGDTNIYRSAANMLKTDDSMIIVGTLEVDSTLWVSGDVTVGGVAGVLKFGSNTMLQLAAGGNTLQAAMPFGFRSYTNAGKPAASSVAAGSVIYVSDGAAGAKFQGSDGAAWVNLG